MPELPEVETVRRGLEKEVVGLPIRGIEATYPRMVLTGFEQLQKTLQGQIITGISRRGKYLIFEIGEHWRLISHLRMEGKYRLAVLDEPLRKHDHLSIKFDDSLYLLTNWSATLFKRKLVQSLLMKHSMKRYSEEN